MIFPDYLKNGDVIGVTAPSRGVDEPADKERFLRGAEKLSEKGFKVQFTANVFAGNDRYGRSSSAEVKASQLKELIEDKSVKAIYSASGGDFLAEILPLVDTDAFKSNPKWIQGYSDNTSLLYYLTTKCDIATVYGFNFSDFGMDPWQESVERGFKVLTGEAKEQTSFEFFQNGFGSRETGKEGYSEDEPVCWKNVYAGEEQNSCPCEKEVFYDNNTEILMEGRLIGGCMDVLLNISGTPYDGTLDFIEKYKEDGIIWYLESFDLHFEQMMEGLWKMKEMGWFKYAKGFIFGRPLFYPTEAYDGSPLPSYEEILTERLKPLGLPVISDADIGHKGPQFVMINGAKARIESAGGKGRILYI
ncbi:MAG: LD-carboxypeptidase, partial [Parasporobacterium sp.]|nr:LD-carboxypeptidase [Parasporobacterium sp.]